MWKPGPAYPATVAALAPMSLFRLRIFCSRGSLTPVAAPNVSPNDFFWHVAGCGEADSEPCLEGCGLRASCGNRGQRTRPAGSKLPCRALIRLRRLAALKGHCIPAQGANFGNPRRRRGGRVCLGADAFGVATSFFTMGGGAPAAWGFFGGLGAGAVEDFVTAALPDDVGIGEGLGEKSFVGKKLIGDHPELSTGAEGGHGGGHEFMTEHGIRLTALVEWGVHDHGIEIEYQVKEEMVNPARILHGGIAATMLDDIIGMTVFMMGNGVFYSTVNLSVDYLFSARLGETVRVKSKIVRMGKKIAHAEGEIRKFSQLEIEIVEEELKKNL